MDIETTLSRLMLGDEVGIAAQEIELYLSGALNDPPQGIYLAHRHEPVCSQQEEFYILNSERTELRVFDPLAQTSDVFIKQGDILKPVIPKQFLRRNPQLASHVPFHNYCGFKVIESLIYSRLATLLKFPLNYNGQSAADAFYLNFYDVETVDSTVFEKKDKEYLRCLEILDPIMHQLDLFVGRYGWHIHDVCVSPSGIVIQRKADWRAALYVEKQKLEELERLQALDEMS